MIFIKTLKEQIEEMSTESQNIFDIRVDNAIVYSHQLVINYILLKYAKFKTESLTVSFQLYLETMNEDIKRMYNAFYSEYNPIENYNGTEIKTFVDKHGTKTTVNDATTDTTDKTTTYNDLNFRDLDASNTVANGSSTENYNDVTLDGLTGHNVSREILSKHGNIGVTQTQTMIENEISLRMNPYFERIVDKYVAKYCFLMLGGYDCDC